MSRFEPSLPHEHGAIAGPHDVSLRAIAEQDLDDLMRWRRDPEVIQFWDVAPDGIEEYRKQLFGRDTVPVWRFIIEWQGRGVGEIDYHHPYADTDYLWSAGIDIFVGEPAARNRGVGTEAVRTMLKHLFEVKRVHRVTIDPEVGNARAIRSYQKAGFRLDGVVRHNDRFDDGRYVDTQYLSILEDEWPEARALWDAERRS